VDLGAADTVFKTHSCPEGGESSLTHGGSDFLNILINLGFPFSDVIFSSQRLPFCHLLPGMK